MDAFELAALLRGGISKSGTGSTRQVQGIGTPQVVSGTALSDSADGKVVVDLGGMSVTQDGTQGVEIDTVPSVLAGQEVSVEIVGGKATATGVIGWGDGLASGIQDAIDMAEAAILSVDVEYANSQSQTVPPAGGWATEVPAWQEGWYIWQRTKTVASTGESYSDPVCISGRDGQDGAQGPQGATGPQGPKGDDGTGVSAIVEQYYLSTSATSQTGGSWQTSQPAWQEGWHIWTRSQITWTDSTVTYTAPVLAQAVNGANSAASHAQSDVDASRSWYAECATPAATAAKVATITPATDAFALSPGKTVFVRFAATNTAAVGSLTLDVDGTGARPVKTLYNWSLSNLYHASHLAAGITYQCVYDGSVWIVYQNVNVNTYDRVRHSSAVKAAAAITASRIICGTSAGYRALAGGASFDAAYPLLLVTTNMGAGTVSTWSYEAYPSVNAALTGTVQSGGAGRMLYLKGTLSGGTFTVASTDWLTTVIPASADGMLYIPLGVMSDATRLYFKPSPDLYGFADGRFQRLDKAALDIADAAKAVADATAQHFWDDAEGAHVTQSEQEEWDASHSGPNTLWNAAGMLFRDGLTNLLGVLSGTVPGQRGIAVYDGEGNDATDIVASFTGAGMRVGRMGGAGVSVDAGGIRFDGSDGAVAGKIGSGAVGTVGGEAAYSGTGYHEQPITFHLSGMPDGTPPVAHIKFEHGQLHGGGPYDVKFDGPVQIPSSFTLDHMFWTGSIAASGDGFDLTITNIDDYQGKVGWGYRLAVRWWYEGASPYVRFGIADGEGAYSLASGVGNTVTGAHATALGYGLVADRDDQLVAGRYNQPTPGFLVVGDGASGESRSNALVVDPEGKLHASVHGQSLVAGTAASQVAHVAASTPWAYLTGTAGSANYCRWRCKGGAVFVEAYFESSAGIQAYAARRCGTIPAPYRPDHEVDAGGYLGSRSDHAAAIWVAADGGVHLACANGISSGSFYGSISYPRQD